MSVISQTTSNSDDSGVTTLGDVLLGDSKPRTAESVWVGLVQSIATGDQSALRDLYDRMHAIVYTLTMRILQNTHTAEEVTLDVFVDIWTRARAYDAAGGTVVGWVMNQARSRAIDRLRFESRKKRVDPFPESPESHDEQDSGALIDMRSREKQLRAAVAQLTPNERSAIEMAFFSECTYAEVAMRLNEPPGTVKTRIRSGLEKLRHALIVEGHP